MTEQTTTSQGELPQGSTHTLWNTFKVVTDHYGTYERLFEKYGDTARLKALNGDIVATRDTELIRQIFARNPGDYDPFAVGALTPLIGEGSVLVTGGEAHKKARKLLMPPFHGERMRAYGEGMREIAHHWLRAQPEGEVIVLNEVMTEVSLDVIIRAVFGVVERERAARAREVMVTTIASLSPVFLFSKATQRSFFGGGPWVKFQEQLTRAKRMIDEEIAIKERDGYGEDILSMLLQVRDEEGEPFTREELYHHLFTLLVAGHETTAVALSWAFYHLLKHPEKLARARQEVDEAYERGASVEELAKLPYVNAVGQEALRLYPIVPDVVRQLNSPMKLGDYEVPAGKCVSVAIVSVHHDPRVFERPLEFEPERFLERKFKPWEYMPFGGGHRRCIGAAFASYEMALVLATWLREGELELCDAVVEPRRRNLTIGPSTGVRVRVRPRQR